MELFFINLNLPALLLWNLVAFFNWLFPALLQRLLPAFSLRDLDKSYPITPEGKSTENKKSYIDAHFVGDRVTSFLGHLLANLMRNLLALRVGHLNKGFRI